MQSEGRLAQRASHVKGLALGTSRDDEKEFVGCVCVCLVLFYFLFVNLLMIILMY